MTLADLVETVRQTPHELVTYLAVGLPVVLVAMVVLLYVVERRRLR